jgi:hypothetical protein
LTELEERNVGLILEHRPSSPHREFLIDSHSPPLVTFSDLSKLYWRTIEGLLLKCLSEEEAKLAMGKVHEGMCGAHQLAHKMSWTLRRVGVFSSTMLKDCFDYYRGCESCQKFAKL